MNKFFFVALLLIIIPSLSSWAESVKCRVYEVTKKGEEGKTIHKVEGNVIYRSNSGDVYFLGNPPNMNQKRVIKTKGEACVSDGFEILEDLSVIPAEASNMAQIEVEDKKEEKTDTEKNKENKVGEIKKEESGEEEKKKISKKGVVDRFLKRIREDD